MNFETNVNSGQVNVTLSGKIYVDDAASLRESLLEYVDQGYKNFHVSMDHVDYIDSSGLGVLVAVQKRVLEHQGQIVLSGLHGAVKEIFELTRLTKVFQII